MKNSFVQALRTSFVDTAKASVGVCMMESGSANKRRAIAMGTGLAETAFLTNSSPNNFHLFVYNANGEEVFFSPTAPLAAARYLLKEKLVNKASPIALEYDGRIVSASVSRDGSEQAITIHERLGTSNDRHAPLMEEPTQRIGTAVYERKIQFNPDLEPADLFETLGGGRQA